MWSLEQAVAPALEPLTLDEVRDHLRIDTNDQDAYLDALLVTGRRHVEQLIARALLTQTWKLYLDYWPCSGVIRLPRPPLQSVTSIQYVDPLGVTQTLGSALYDVDVRPVPARIAPAYGQAWPSVRVQAAVPAVIVTYVAGWQARGDIPEEVRQALLRVIAMLDQNREGALAGDAVKDWPLVAELVASERCYYDFGEECG